jgi:hypothetical protein
MFHMAQPSGHGYWYAGSKYSLRGRLFDGTLPVNLGWYVELEWRKTPQFDQNELQLNTRPIVGKEVGRWSMVLNPRFDKAILTGARQEQGFRVWIRCRHILLLVRVSLARGGILRRHRIDRRSEPLHTQQHYVFLLLRSELPSRVEYNIGPGFGMARGSNHLIMKFNFGVERFLGAVFGPSANGISWF